MVFGTKEPGAGHPRPFAAATGQQQAAAAQSNGGYPAQRDALAPAGTAGRGGQFTVQLSQPLRTHNGDVRELALRAPTLTDYVEIGDIDTVVATEFEDGVAKQLTTKTDFENMMAWAVRLTGHDRIVLGKLPPHDAGELIRMVRLLVVPFARGHSAEKSQTSPSNAA